MESLFLPFLLADVIHENLPTGVSVSQRPSDAGASITDNTEEERDVNSATLADRVLSTLPSVSRTSSALASSQEALAMLSLWLPKGTLIIVQSYC